ncbi:hypothetical protein FSP39_010471, partial [Pinctada imbricata]
IRNLALRKETFQSGTYRYNEYHYDINGTSDKAVDGDSSADFYLLSCAHTVESNTPYWYVDLGNEHRIQHVEITNRGDCCAERLHDVEVSVAGPNKEFNMICGSFKGPGTTSQIVVIDCPYGMKGRYVKLQIVEGTENSLTLCEVKVMGL